MMQKFSKWSRNPEKYGVPEWTQEHFSRCFDEINDPHQNAAVGVEYYLLPPNEQYLLAAFCNLPVINVYEQPSPVPKEKSECLIFQFQAGASQPILSIQADYSQELNTMNLDLNMGFRPFGKTVLDDLPDNFPLAVPLDWIGMKLSKFKIYRRAEESYSSQAPKVMTTTLEFSSVIPNTQFGILENYICGVIDDASHEISLHWGTNG